MAVRASKIVGPCLRTFLGNRVKLDFDKLIFMVKDFDCAGHGCTNDMFSGWIDLHTTKMEFTIITFEYPVITLTITF
jgi:hypothetical protein